MTRLSTKVSQAVVTEIVARLGEVTASKALRATPSRLKTLTAGRGTLSGAAVEQIRQATGKTWRTWLVESMERGGAAKSLIAPAKTLVNALNRAENDAGNEPKKTRWPSRASVA
jgi:hypothetical protein